MKTEIHDFFTKRPGSVISVYGFGSFFHKIFYKDIDLLFVIRPDGDLLYAYEISHDFSKFLEELFQTPIDFTVLTVPEFQRRPLRDMDSLIPLYSIHRRS